MTLLRNMGKEATAPSIATAFNKKYKELFQKYSSLRASHGCEKKKSGRRAQDKYRNLCFARKGCKKKKNKGLRSTLLSTPYNRMLYDKTSIIRAFRHKHHTQSTRSTAPVSIPAVQLINATQHTNWLKLRLAITKK